MKDRNVLPLVVVLSDGRANVAMDGGKRPGSGKEARNYASIFEDKSMTSVVYRYGTGTSSSCRWPNSFAEAMGARYLKLEDLRADSLADAVRNELPTAAGSADSRRDSLEEDADEMRRLYDSLGRG